MTTQLPERLRALAEDAPDALSGHDLWRTGRRRHRVRVATALTVAACLVLVTAFLGDGMWRSRQPGPATPPATNSGPMGVPDRFFHPSPWLPGTRAPGRLVAVLGTERGRFPFGQDLNAYVGVTAGSQAYHFLDLPGQAADTDVALSPDGRHLAYWVSGTPLGPARLGDRSVVGVANLDLTTGTIQRKVLPGTHGLSPTMLSWTVDNRLAVATDHFTSAEPTSYSGRTRVYYLMWQGGPVGDLTRTYQRTSTPDVLMDRFPGMNVLPVPVTSTQGYAGIIDHRTLRVYAANHTVRQTIRLSDRLHSVVYDAGRGRVAGNLGDPYGSGSTSGPLMVGRVEQRQSGKPYAQLSEVPGRQKYLYVLAWADSIHVVAEQLTHTGELFWVVDVHTGARTPLTSTGYQATGSRWFSLVLAGDALRHPTTTAAIAPPRPWNPRWVAGGALAAVVLAGAVGLSLALRRRRVRR